MSECAIRSIARDFQTVRALDHLDLEVPVGALFGFLGPNGSGKTTTIRSTGILASLRSPTVRQASQTVSVIVLALVLIPAGLSQIAPAEWIQSILNGVDQVGPVAAGIVVAVLLAAIDAAMVVAGMGRFKRGRLIAV